MSTFYGLPHEKANGLVDLQHSRIADPADATRIFSWLICQSYDDKGNAIVYEYQSEDSQRIFEDQQGQFVALAHERNRSESSRSANRYLKRIKYGNRTPNRDATTWQATDPAQLPNETWMFEVVFDYGEGHHTEDAPDAQGVSSPKPRSILRRQHTGPFGRTLLHLPRWLRGAHLPLVSARPHVSPLSRRGRR